MTNHHCFLMTMFREFPYSKSDKGREARAFFWWMANLAPASFQASCPGAYVQGRGFSENQARVRVGRLEVRFFMFFVSSVSRF